MREITPMPNKFKRALTRMGYRHMGNEVWGKPVAFHLLIVFLDAGTLTMFNHFKGANNQVLLWDRHELDVDNLESSIKFAEYGTRVDVGQPSSGGDFSFITQKEMIESFL